MPSLHLIKSPITPAQLDERCAMLANGDGILFLQDACYSLKSKAIDDRLSSVENTCYVIAQDLTARNIDTRQCQLIDYNEFVELTLKYQNTISW